MTNLLKFKHAKEVIPTKATMYYEKTISWLKNKRAELTPAGETREYLDGTVQRLENRRANVLLPAGAKGFFKRYLKTEKCDAGGWNGPILARLNYCYHLDCTRGMLYDFARKIVENEGITVPEEQIGEAVVKLKVVRFKSRAFGPEVYAGSFEPEYPRIKYNFSGPWGHDVEKKVSKEPKVILVLPKRIRGLKAGNVFSGLAAIATSQDTAKGVVSKWRTAAASGAGELAGAIETALREVLPKTEVYAQKINEAA